MAQLVPYFPMMTPRAILFFVFEFDAESAIILGQAWPW